MTLETVYYITQIIAVGAILISLVAIYIQQRQTHSLARAEHEREILAKWEAAYDVITREPDALNSVRICLQDYEGAAPNQQAWFGHLMHIIINITERNVYLKRDKLARDVGLQDVKAVIRPFLAAPGGEQFWHRARLAYGVDVRQVIDGALLEPYDGPMIWELFPFYGPETNEASESKSEDKTIG